MNFNYLCQREFNSLMATPVNYNDEVLGVLFIDSDTKKAFGENDAPLLESFADLLSMTVNNFNIINDLEMNTKLFSIFYEASKHLNANLELAEVLDILGSLVQEVYEYDRISVSLKDEDNKAKIHKVIGKTAGFEEGAIFDIGDGLNGYVIRKSKSILVSDLEKGDYFIPRYSSEEKNNFGMRAFIGAPISYGDSCIGVVTVESETTGIYVEHHEKMLIMLAQNIGSALERTMITKRLQTLAVTDELTGLYNYRALKTRLAEEVERAKRYNSGFSLLMMDIDKFKEFNDSYGHVIGDFALREISKELKDSLRNIDFVGRYGGEEFVAILIETKLKNAIHSAGRIRENIASKNNET